MRAMHHRHVLAVLAVLAVGVGCAGGDGAGDETGDETVIEAGGGDVRACVDVYVDGGPVDDDVWAGECIDADGNLSVVGAARLDCSDGSAIGWNDLAWWDTQVHVHAVDADELVAPADVRDACA